MKVFRFQKCVRQNRQGTQITICSSKNLAVVVVVLVVVVLLVPPGQVGASWAEYYKTGSETAGGSW